MQRDGELFSNGEVFFLSRRVFFSLTEFTDFTETFCALFRTHRRPSAYRYHRGLLAKEGCWMLGVRC